MTKTYYDDEFVTVHSVLKIESPILVYTNNEGLEELKQINCQYEILKTQADYPATLLTLNFANPAKRESVLGKRYLIKLTE